MTTRDKLARVIFDHNATALGSAVTFEKATERMKRTAYEYADAILASGVVE